MSIWSSFLLCLICSYTFNNILKYIYIYIYFINLYLIMVKNPPAIVEDSKDTCLIPGSGRTPWVGNGDLFQYPYLGNPMDSGAWICFSVLAWKILQTVEPGGLLSMGFQRVGHYWVTERTHTQTHIQSRVVRESRKSWFLLSAHLYLIL